MLGAFFKLIFGEIHMLSRLFPCKWIAYLNILYMCFKAQSVYLLISADWIAQLYKILFVKKSFDIIHLLNDSPEYIDKNMVFDKSFWWLDIVCVFFFVNGSGIEYNEWRCGYYQWMSKMGWYLRLSWSRSHLLIVWKSAVRFKHRTTADPYDRNIRLNVWNYPYRTCVHYLIFFKRVFEIYRQSSNESCISTSRETWRCPGRVLFIFLWWKVFFCFLFNESTFYLQFIFG